MTSENQLIVYSNFVQYLVYRLS